MCWSQKGTHAERTILPCFGKRKQVQFRVKMTYRYHFGSRSKSNTIDYITSHYCMWFWRKSRCRKKHVQVVLENSKAKRSKSMLMHEPIVRVNSDRFSGRSCFLHFSQKLKFVTCFLLPKHGSIVHMTVFIE